MLDSGLKKETFKKLTRKQVKKFWYEQYTVEITSGNLKSLKYFHPSSFKIGRPSLIWLCAKHHPFESAKAIVIAKMVSGRYRTDWLERH